VRGIFIGVSAAEPAAAMGRAVTHGPLRELARRYPADPGRADQIFLRAGRFYTTAGMTAGRISPCPGQDDLGRDWRTCAAPVMVVSLKRPGGQV